MFSSSSGISIQKAGARLLHKKWRQFVRDSLFRNAVFLMLSAAVTAVLGFGFWVVASHLYRPADIGLAMALISITMLITNLSLFGLNQGFVRFLPTSKRKSGDINAAFTIVAGLAVVASAVYLSLSGQFGGQLAIFSSSLSGRLVFIALMVVVCLNTLTDKVFVASRRGEFHTLGYATFGLVKLLAPLFLIRYGSLGIFAAYILAAAIALALSLWLMRRAVGYRLRTRPNWTFIGRSWRYSVNNYLATLVSGLPAQLMPAIIIAHLGKAPAAFFSLAWMMANVIYVIPSAISGSILAEASNNGAHQADSLRRGSKLMLGLLAAIVAVACIVAPVVLRIFGHEYAAGATQIFQLLAVLAFPMAANAIGTTIMNIEHRTGSIVVVQTVTAAATMVLTSMLLGSDDLGLTGVGFALIGGAIIGNVVQLALLMSGPPVGDPTAADRATPVPEGAALALLASYGLETATIKPGGYGASAETFVVSKGRHKYVLKVYRNNRRTEAHLEHEAGFTDFLANHGHTVVRFVRTASGNSFASARIKGKRVVGALMMYVPGRHPSTYTPGLVRKMAHAQAHMHADGIKYATMHKADTKKLASTSLRAALLGFMPRGVSHFDFDASNLLVIGENDEISGTLDFENMRYDPLVTCLFFTLCRIYDVTNDRSMVATYLKEYRSVRALNWFERLVIGTGLALRYRDMKLMLA